MACNLAETLFLHGRTRLARDRLCGRGGPAPRPNRATCNFPNLRHVKVTLRRLLGNGLAPFRLADAHSATLETLDICICDVASGDTGTTRSLPAFTRHYPCLKRLVLAVDKTFASHSLRTSVLSSITAERFPRLTHLMLEGFNNDVEGSVSGLSKLVHKADLVIRNLPPLRENAFSTPRLVGYCSPRSRSFNTNYGQELNRLRRIQMAGGAIDGLDPLDALERADHADFSPGGPLLRELEDTIGYLVNRVQHAKRIGDRTALVKLAERVREVAREKWIMEA